MSVSTVKQTIRRAFGAIPVPRAIIDTETGDQETRSMFKAELEGKRWDEIPTRVLSFHHDALFFLEPAGFHYLLPAFMIAALECPESHLVEALVFALTKPEDPSDLELFLETMSLLDDSQRAAVRSFLEFLREEEPENWPDDAPGRALREYWTD